VSGPGVFDPVTGTYHVMGNLFKMSGEYTVRAEILAIGSEQTNEKMVDEFRMVSLIVHYSIVFTQYLGGKLS
jgi:hypothetical protein